MPIQGAGWELHIMRRVVQRRPWGTSERIRTVGDYQVYHAGVAVAELSGTIAEPKGPGDNTPVGSRKDLRVAAGRYALATQAGTRFKTIGYSMAPAALNNFVKGESQPSLELLQTGTRKEILIHPGIVFLSSEGCINPSRPLPDSSATIEFRDSRRRMIAIIEDLKTYSGARWPGANGRSIPNAWVVIDGEPA